MADQDRRRRFAARLKRLLDVAVEQKNVSGGVSLARLVMDLEGWRITPSKEDPPQPTPTPDMSNLLLTAGLDTAPAEKEIQHGH